MMFLNTIENVISVTMISSEVSLLKHKTGQIGFKFTFSLTITLIECPLYNKIEKNMFVYLK